ncbi:hypothetical protein EVB32_002 [Rhizobium phage RHph_TM39]|nr:hypothetical protein EVB94_002 [Rhizobium phage RHph_TM40]QIG72198.1 hypothetical protein EVB96_002 [Rhizobium phage RHph_TM3_3_6]QIG76990.1 hypothetical protein EVB32_002 [Rhizobium phage RHph_TM39]
MAKPTCCWIIRPASYNKETGESVKAIYCGKPVRYKIEIDDDMNKRRKYNNLCDTHQKESDEISKNNPEDDDWNFT